MNTISHPKNLETILPTVRGKVTGLWFNVLEYLFSYYLSSVLRHWWLGITKSTHTHPFNGPLSRTTRVSRYQKGETNLDFTEARDSERQWHQLGHMQICTSLQTDNHTNTSPLSFYRPDALPAVQPTASEHWRLQRASGLQKLSDEVSVRKRFKRFAYATATPSSLGSLESRMVCPSCAGLPWFSW